MVQGWITAIATAILAAFAIITAIYAVRAFREQSQEVSDEAEMLCIQSDQFAEQRKINERQTGVLALQAAELRESSTSASARQWSAGTHRQLPLTDPI